MVVIKLSEYINDGEPTKMLNSRDIVKEYAELYRGEQKIILDFDNIKFISRGFSHELFFYIIHNTQKEIVPVNMGESVARMFFVIVRDYLNFCKTAPSKT